VVLVFDQGEYYYPTQIAAIVCPKQSFFILAFAEHNIEQSVLAKYRH
jgi:hypothetical protein